VFGASPAAIAKFLTTAVVGEPPVRLLGLSAYGQLAEDPGS
jgi:hypothetical protein